MCIYRDSEPVKCCGQKFEVIVSEGMIFVCVECHRSADKDRMLRGRPVLKDLATCSNILWLNHRVHDPRKKELIV